MNVSTADGRETSSSGKGPLLVPALTVVSHPMADRVGDRLLLDARAAGREVAVSRNAPDFLRPGSALGQHLADPFLSRKPLVLSPGQEGRIRLDPGAGSAVAIADQPLRVPWEFQPEEIAAGVPLTLAERVVLLLHFANPEPMEAANALDMVGTSVGIQRVRRLVRQVADLNVPVLIRGETGSGKELIARAIHQQSKRREQAFLSVNLGAIPKELAAAELFGVRKGAFTGAVRDTEGFFRAAHGGTLFLDEVGEAPLEVQTLLLRALETQEIFPVGDRSPFRVDVRLVAATDALLEAQIEDGRFKAPLLHRLSGYVIRVPPLRERCEDIGPLFHHFAREELEATGEVERLSPQDPYAEPWLPASLASRLVRCAWPGNIRQLRNVTRQLVIGSRGLPRLVLDGQLEQELYVPDAAPIGSPVSARPAAETRATRRKPSDISEAELLAALRENGWDFQAASDQLGVHRTSIYDLIERCPSIRTAGALSVEEITRCYQECQGDLDAMVKRLEVSKRALGRRIRELGLGADEA